MKQIFSIVSALVLSGTMFAQTIAIDGANTDWSTVPMLTEPGVGPVVKMVVPQDGLNLPEGTAYALMVEGDHEQILAGYPVIYTDADKSNTTGTANWFCPTMGYDYEMAIWADMSIFANNNEGSIREMAVKLSAFSDAQKFTGSISAWLTFNWGELYIPNTPLEDEWKWMETQYHPFNLAPYSYADFASTHTAAAAYSTHQALLPGESLQLGYDNPNDTALWASWTVELKEATTYYIILDIIGTTGASADLWLVDVATNKVVAEFVGEDIDSTLGKQAYGSWDLSAVPAGKYMLKLKNHVQWADMALKSVTLVRSCSVNITSQDNNMGSVKVDKEIVNDNQISIIATANANHSYHFTQWSDGNTDNPRSIVLTQDTSFVAHFAPNNYAISTQSSDAERGTTSGNVTTTYLDNVIISATANYGYHFTQWNDGNIDNPRYIQVTEDKTYTAYFDKNTYHITKNYDSNQGYVDGYSSGEYLDNIILTADPNYGYHFVQWSDGVTDNPRSFVLTQDTTFVAVFAPNNYTISTLSSDIECGTTSGDITTTYLDYVTISATANYGYHFSHWNDYNYDNPRQVQVTEDKTYTAYFDKNTYYITKNYDSNQGYVNGYSSGEYLDNITLTAEPNPGYHFTQWADGNTDNPRTIILTQDTIMMAEFAQSYSGQCGDNLYWAYDNTTQKLSISGMGDMYDYTATTQPWVLFKEEIMAVDIINTATSIGASAFEGCKRLGSVNIGVNIEDIGANAFAGCARLYDIYCYPIYPPFVEASSFANYNVYLYVPCLNIREYEMDIVWGNFKYIQCMGAEGEEIEDGTVEVTTSTNSVTITWPTEENANTYIIEIKKDGVVFCRLTFNADGQLLNISFVPGRDGNHPAQFAIKTTNGL